MGNSRRQRGCQLSYCWGDRAAAIPSAVSGVTDVWWASGARCAGARPRPRLAASIGVGTEGLSPVGRTVPSVTNRRATTRAASEFAEAVDRLRQATLRPEVGLTEIPAPQRIAPHSVALSAEISTHRDDEPLATGRFVILFDDEAPAAWDGRWRIVTLARAQLEPELAGDPLLGEVGWSWLTDALHTSGVAHRALGGTVTRVVSESFGTLGDTEPTVEMELRASWTPDGNDLVEHLTTWTDVLATIAGVPPVPQGVTPLSHRMH